MIRADSLIQSTIASARNCGQSVHLVQTSSAWYYFLIHSENNDLYWQKSTNLGISWTSPVLIKGTITGAGLAVWYDRWTPGDTGNLVHLAFLESVSNNVQYITFNTLNDTVGSEVTVFDGASIVVAVNTCLSVTKARGGNIYVAFDVDGGTETGFYYSASGVSFSALTDVNEATSDYYKLYPGNYADTQDIDCAYWDRSANELSLKVFDNSANSWSEASIATSMTAIASNVVCSQFDGTIRPSDGHLLLAAWSASDAANADLRCWDINGTAGIVEKTNVITDSVDDQGGCAIQLDTGTNNIIVYYFGKSDGSETAYTSMALYCKISTDGGATWGSETLVNSMVKPLTWLHSCLTCTDEMYAAVFGGIAVTLILLYATAAIPSKSPTYLIGV